MMDQQAHTINHAKCTKQTQQYGGADLCLMNGGDPLGAAHCSGRHKYVDVHSTAKLTDLHNEK